MLAGKPALLCLAFAAAALAGCGSTKLDRQPSEESRAIELAALKTERRVGELSIERAAVAAERFLAERRFGYGDRLIIEGGEPAQRARLERLLAAPGRSIAARAGLDGGPELRLTLIRTVATPPTCADWSDPPTQDFSNLPASNWGCATQSNLARMIADPNDLAGGRGSGPLDSDKLTVVIDANRRGAIIFTDYTVSGSTSGGE
ncbi:MAG: CpaD family pilus assembly lipoprotein [Marivibrio sp.]|uniref:CpaD family pilus assembly lipoprotein n=1 Tax=Marivibrio sp. TaxID=2039719 RepID=UPI0032EDF46D